MKKTIERGNTLIESYREVLAQSGICLTLSKRYFEEAVGERTGDVGRNAIFNEMDRARDRKREKDLGYHHVRNRYHVIVLSVCPIEAGTVRREDCREYAFFLRKTERAHVGEAPTERSCGEQKVLRGIEKRILKIVRKSRKSPPQKVCQNTLWDAIRYTLPRYGYKKRFLNKDRADWEILCLIGFGVLALAFALGIWLIGKL